MPISASLLLSDAAGLTISSATVAITNWNSHEDRMTFYNSAALAHTFNVNNATNTAVLTLTGNASVAAYQTELRSLMYQDVNLNSPVLTACGAGHDRFRPTVPLNDGFGGHRYQRAERG